MLDRALARNLLSEAEVELASMRKRQRDLESLVASLRSVLNIDQPSQSTKAECIVSAGSAGTARVGSKRYRTEVAIEQFLRDSGKPMHRMQIKDHLVQLGIIGGEKAPLSVVSHALSSSNKFRSHGSGLWKLATMPDAVVESAPHASMTA